MQRKFKELFLNHTGKLSDKWASYIEKWDNLFGHYQDLEINIMEIGIQNGGSLEIYADYFTMAKNIVGCDVYDACDNLVFKDPRIRIIVGDINSDEVEEKISKISPNFDVIIDDGSHITSDTIKAFARYFNRLNENGVYVVEDLHTSYWQEFEGGLYNPYSMMSFLKRLADITQFEHWRNTETRKSFLTGFNQHYGLTFDEFELCKIHSVTFYNSICIIEKKSASNNKLGDRLIVGSKEPVSRNYQRLNGTTIHDYAFSISDDSSLDVLNLLSEKKKMVESLEVKGQEISELTRKYKEEKEEFIKNKLDHENKISGFLEKIRNQENKIEQLINHIQQKDDQLNESNLIIDQLSNDINQLKATIDEQAMIVEKFEEAIQQEQEKFSNVASINTNLQTRLHEIDNKLQSYEKQIQELNVESNAKEDEIVNYALHPSWKITRLHRKFMRILEMVWTPKVLYSYLIIKRSGLFNPEYYLKTNPDIRKKNIDPLQHFVKYGWKEGRNPSESINITNYLTAHPELYAKGQNPLLAMIKKSKDFRPKLFTASYENLVTKKDYELVKQSGLFSSKEYLLKYPDVRRADIDPLEHYLKFGWREGRDPSSLFHTQCYLEKIPELIETNTNPLVHFLQQGNNASLPITRHFSILNQQFNHIDLEAYESRMIALPFHCDNPPTKPDILIFPIIDWDFRFQRPQHLALHLAKAGHRVFYISTGIRQAGGPNIKAIGKNIYSVTLSIRDNSLDHFFGLTDEKIDDLIQSINTLRNTFIINTGVMIIDQPLWAQLAVHLKDKWGWKLVYDCMDLHAGFTGTHPNIEEAERLLLGHCDKVLVTSEYLRQHLNEYNHQAIIIPNGTDFEFFHQARKEINDGTFENLTKPVLGYIGAIAEWFDTYLIGELAREHPEWTFLLVGSTDGADITPLERLPNVKIMGEKPYELLPMYLSHFDVCLIPFKKTSLTHATNPVKLYEYLSSGKPVISTRLVETSRFQDFVDLADTKEDWEAAIQKSLSEEKTSELLIQRYSFAKNNTWEKRGESLLIEIHRMFPKISIIMVTHNQLQYTKQCISSILENTSYPNYEVLIADNGSTDGTLDYLNNHYCDNNKITVIENDQNLGLPKAINQASYLAQGDYLVFLNNDTIVTPGWLSRMYGYLFNDSKIGMVGPVTNSIGNEAKIDVGELKQSDIKTFAAERAIRKEGRTFEIDVLALYCCMISRELFSRIGGLDERYEIGMFEDDDLAMMVKEAGYKLLCAEDVYVHHYHGASFKKLPPEIYEKVFKKNLGKFEKKWGIKWRKHSYR